MIRSGRHPHEVLILSGCVVYGVAGFSAFDRVAITSIRELPGPVGHMFYALLAVTAAVRANPILKTGSNASTPMAMAK